MRYFAHDVNASIDDKIMTLRMMHGGAAVDAYWTIIERLYRDERPLVVAENQPETKSVCHWLCVGFDGFSEYVNGMLEVGLLVDVSEDDSEVLLWSERVDRQIGELTKKAETARKNGKNGGRPPKKKTDENQQETQSVSKQNPEKANYKLETINLYKEISPNGDTKKDDLPFAEVVDYLNAQTGKKFKPTSKKTRGLIAARFNEGFSLDDFKAVIDTKVAKWGNDPKMADFLRPETLFGTKFEGYLNEQPRGGTSAEFDEYAARLS